VKFAAGKTHQNELCGMQTDTWMSCSSQTGLDSSHTNAKTCQFDRRRSLKDCYLFIKHLLFSYAQTNPSQQVTHLIVFQGEGVAYRGRALVELQTVLDEKPLTAVEDILPDELTRVQV
jgi:hypothetical protein